MAGFIKIQVEKFPTQPLSTKVDAEIFEAFQKKCKERNLQMCTVIETFARQYVNGRYDLKREDIVKWESKDDDVRTLNTPINKTIHNQFKNKLKSDGDCIKYVISAFIEDYVKNDLIMEFTRK